MREPTGRDVFEACMAKKLLNDIRGWDRRETRETFKGDVWVGFNAGLQPEEKSMWNRVAERLREITSTDKSDHA